MEATMEHDFDLKNFQFSTDVPYKTVVERYYTPRYKIDLKKKKGEDMCILTHSNKLCVITLAPSHPILLNKKSVTKVDFQVMDGNNLLDNAPSGKSKRGARNMRDFSKLCTATCDDGTEYVLHNCIPGKLIEVNENLVGNPSLLTEKPSSDGYIAILTLRYRNYKYEMDRLLTKEQYEEALEKRANEPEEVEMKEEEPTAENGEKVSV